MKLTLLNNFYSNLFGITDRPELAWVDADLVASMPTLKTHRVWRLPLGLLNDTAEPVTIEHFFDPNRNKTGATPIELFFAAIYDPETDTIPRECFITPHIDNGIWRDGARASVVVDGAVRAITTGDRKDGENLVLQPGDELRALQQYALIDSTRVRPGLYFFDLFLNSLGVFGPVQASGAWAIETGSGQVKIIAEL